jgi:hypothetical protein
MLTSENDLSMSLPSDIQDRRKLEHKSAAQIVICDPKDLCPHPSYARLGLAVSATHIPCFSFQPEVAHDAGDQRPRPAQ